VRGEIFGVRKRQHVRRNLGERVGTVFDEVHTFEEGLHRQAGRMRGRTARRKDVVRSGAVVTEGHRRVRADEHAAGIANPLSYSTGVSRDDFEVLRRVTIDDLQALLEVAHENRRRLFAAQRGPDPLDMLRELDLTDELDVYRLS
jgi:hypothetical protein